MKAICCALLSLLCVLALPVLAQDDAKQPWEEYDKLIKSREEIAALGPTLFGDQVNLMNGAMSFSMTDVSVPGNSASLPMAITRTYTVSNRKGYRVNDLPLADWDLDLPRISGVFRSTPPDGGFGTPCTATTATQAMPPQLHIGSSTFSPEDYWQGNQASMPGGGEMLLANAGAPAPSTGGPYYWMTSEFTYFSCLATIKNGAGEGFLAITQDGTKYWFDWMASYQEPDLKDGKGGSDVIPRSKRVLYATKVQDRFGNTVTYTFANASNAPARLTRINGSDGRYITLTYNVQGQIQTVSNGLQTFTYQYSYPSESKGTLTAVRWPSNTTPAPSWIIDFAALSDLGIRYEKPRCVPAGLGQLCDPIRSCGDPGPVITPGAVGTITHPSGAKGEFTVEPVRHGRSNVPMVCGGYTDPYNDPNDDTAYYPLNYDALSVVKKRVTGTGLTPSEWNYSYGSEAFFAPGTGPVCTSSNCGAVVCESDDCAGTAVTVLTGPEGVWERHTFGNSYRYNEGKLLKVETGTGPAGILKTEATAYQLAQSSQPFATPIGHSPQPRGDGFTSEYLRPQLQRTVFQDGASFTHLVTGFDRFARPLGATRSSSLGFTKTDATEYHDDLAKWVVGQVKRQVNADNGEVMAQTDFDAATALPIRQYRFGELQQTLTYRPDGMVASVADGRNNVTSVTAWSRGIPLTIQHPGAVSEWAKVNGIGQIINTTDENGYISTYSYDEMGRLSRITPPAYDTPFSNGRDLQFGQNRAVEFGLPIWSWTRIVIDGFYRKDEYFDALWQPVVQREWSTNVGMGSARYLTRTFDANGRVTFESYPTASAPLAYNSPRSGTRTYYDVLGRVIRSEQDSEQGVLVTTTEYLPGFQRRITNPRGQSTLQQFQVYDEPSYDAPVKQESPEGVTTTIVRDRYLKPLDVTRSGPEG